MSQRTICKSQVSPFAPWAPEMKLGPQRWNLVTRLGCKHFFPCWALSLACWAIFESTALINSTQSCLHGFSGCLSTCKLHMFRMKPPTLSLPATSLAIRVNSVLDVQVKHLSDILCISFPCPPSSPLTRLSDPSWPTKCSWKTASPSVSVSLPYSRSHYLQPGLLLQPPHWPSALQPQPLHSLDSSTANMQARPCTSSA